MFIKCGQYSISTIRASAKMAVYLENTYIDNLAHKILHTFEKMDAINPTFERIDILRSTR
jgi:hypothetical protein